MFANFLGSATEVQKMIYPLQPAYLAYTCYSGTKDSEEPQILVANEGRIYTLRNLQRGSE